jgi:hypothetical protein
MYAIAVVLLNALSFASLAYIANRKGYHAMAALAAAGAWLFGVTGGVLIWGIWRCPGRFPPPWTVEHTDARLQVPARRITWMKAVIAEQHLIGLGSP